MNIVCREMSALDKSMAVQWLGEKISLPFPSDFFPATGVAACHGNVPVCVIPIYLEATSAVAVLGHCVGNPAMTAKMKREAIQEAVKFAVEYARSYSKKHIISIFGARSINRIIDQMNIGFWNADKNVETKYILAR